MPLIKNVDLDKEFGFNPVICPDIKTCVDKLQNFETTAFVAPHSDVLTYFNT